MRGIPMIAALETELVSANAFYMTTALLFLNYAFAFPALTTVYRIFQCLEVSTYSLVKDAKTVVAT
jgi:hypothetical protein